VFRSTLKLLTLLGIMLCSVGGARAQDAAVTVAVSLSGRDALSGLATLDGARMAIEEANSDGAAPPVTLEVKDDQGTVDGARLMAQDLVKGATLVVIGPSLTVASLAAGPVYADGGVASITPTAQGDTVPKSATTFQSVFGTSAMGRSFADYLRNVLGLSRATVVFRDDGFGTPIADGLRTAAARLGIAVTLRAFHTAEERDAQVKELAAMSDPSAIVLGMSEPDAVPVVTTLRRAGVRAPVLGPAALSGEGFAEQFKDLPESGAAPDFFTDGFYAATPILLDSANAETLAFAARYRARYHREPPWRAVQGYDAARLAVAAVRDAQERLPTNASTADRRRAVLAYLARLNSPAHALASLTGPMWFTTGRSRPQAIRIGRFRSGVFESAPLQLVEAGSYTEAEKRSGQVVEGGDGSLQRRQQVVYTGIFVNEVSRIDIAPSTFTADFYLWVRYAKLPDGDDPTEIEFPDLVRGGFDAKRPSVEGDLSDGTTYRLWRVRGDFKNDFDLRRYPMDRQALVIRMIHARAASDHLVYVQDRASLASGVDTGPAGPASIERKGSAAQGGPTGANAAGLSVPGAPVQQSVITAGPSAFRNLTQWEPMAADQFRDVFVTNSALGDSRLEGVERRRELSGYRVEIGLHRRVVTTLAKTLLPLGIMVFMLLCSLWFPYALVKEKVSVVITSALSGAVLLAAVNSQLGNVGYTMAIEIVFYIFFGLCLLSMAAILGTERLRAANHGVAALRVEAGVRVMFVATVSAVAAVAALSAASY